ncbi:MAG: molecular chaperone Hsp90 [Selenomonadaceae bacterium]|nr:molecular chaperone Hsp90 [Selenomonadaceae bacterium]
MTKENLIATAKELIAAPSCCMTLKEKAQSWINSPDDKTIAKEFIAELEKDVTGIDDLVAFANSPQAVQIFGEDGAKNFAAHANELKANGAKYCDCAACTIGLKILENKEIILG